MLKSLVKVYGVKKSDEELIRDFNNGMKDEVISYIYNKNEKLFKQIASQYYGITESDWQSIALEQIWNCFNNYNSEKSKGKLITMICTYYRNAIKTLVQHNGASKRFVNNLNNCESFSAFEGDEDKFEGSGEDDSEYSKIEMLNLIDSLDLNHNQHELCRLAIEGVCDLTSLASFADEMNLSRAGVLKIKRGLQSKLSFLLN